MFPRHPGRRLLRLYLLLPLGGLAEKGVAMRVVRFVMIMAPGNIAMAGYLLLQLFRLKPGDDIKSILLNREAQ